jgi:hypothetical protein
MARMSARKFLTNNKESKMKKSEDWSTIMAKVAGNILSAIAFVFIIVASALLAARAVVWIMP